ncbi:MAG: ADP-ribosylglycohydrolase family protein [Candidatus Uhrbacteria bacterium]|nr:ADP-ribosylglycohydrolase family protein [Candidatus Uhrbacteria bacterium]
MSAVNKDRVLGFFAGVAIGDALFMPVENLTQGQILHRGRITNYTRPDGHKWFNGRDAGTFTDDYALTETVAKSLTRCGGINCADLAEAHLKLWEIEGDPGFGKTTRTALRKLAAGVPISESGKSDNPKDGYGNALPMKLGPVALYSTSDKYNADHNAQAGYVENITNHALMTHHTLMAVESAFGHIVAVRYCLLRNDKSLFSKKEFVDAVLLAMTLAQLSGLSGTQDNLPGIVSTIAHLPLEKLGAEDFIKLYGGGKGYVYHTLPFCYAFFAKNPFSIETLFEVGNAGGDTDTNTSIVGGMLGALNGISIFPQYLLDGLKEKERVLSVANDFYNTFFSKVAL